jgi:heptosyltransferase-2
MTASLVIAPQWIGDAVMTEPLLRRLHARGERLTVGALPWVAPVYRAMACVHEVIEFPFAHGGLQFRARRSIARQLHGRFEVAYVLPNSLKSALLPWLADIPKRVGYLGESRVGLLTHRLKNLKNRPPMVAFYSALSGDADVAHDAPQLQVPAPAVSAVLSKLGLAPHSYVVMVPGAEYGPAKRWPTQHFAALASALLSGNAHVSAGATNSIAASPVSAVLLLGSGKESEICASIAADVVLPASDARLLNLAGSTSLDEAMALIAGARQVVSNDTGLMHVAAALHVPQVAVFGSSSPEHTPPLSDVATVIWLKNDAHYHPPLDCAPCFARDCPLGHLRCLNDITPQRVLAALALNQA